MNIAFTKMHGLGNDFVVIDAISQAISLTTEQVRFIADRHFGIGCDQVLLLESPESGEADFRYRIFNADGGEVEQCGNGARCFARFAREKGLSDKDRIQVETLSGIIQLEINEDGWVTVDMGTPWLEPDQIPFVAEHQSSLYTIKAGEEEIQISAVSMGNPHAVLVVDSVADAPVATLGPLIEQHERFPKRANAGFMEIVDRAHIRLRVYERGAGETLACGSGACAAVVSGQMRELLDERVHVELPGGELVVDWSGQGQPVFLTGPATTVFEGSIEL
jgi:diaminopimelate epimerase